MAKTGLLGNLGQTLGQMNTDPLSVFRGGMPNTDLETSAGMGAPGILHSPEAVAAPDNWRPHAPTLLGALADAYLESRGMKPAFAQSREQKNLQEAMDGFAQDPQRAIERIGKIRGHEGDAFKLYDQYSDNQRLQHSQDRQDELAAIKQEDYVRGVTASILGSVKPGDAASYARARDHALKYGQAHGYDFSTELPEDGDTFDSDSFRYGAVKTKDQMTLQEREAYHNRTAGISQQRANQDANYKNARLQQIDEGLTERKSHNRTMEGQGQERIDKPRAAPREKPSVSYVNTKYGPGEVSPNGKMLKITRQDGDAIYYNVGNNQWKLVKKIPKAEPKE
jgi:hypothetical protein